MERAAISHGSWTYKEHHEFEVKVCRAGAVRKSRSRREVERALALKPEIRTSTQSGSLSPPPPIKWRPC